MDFELPSASSAMANPSGGGGGGGGGARYVYPLVSWGNE